MHQDQRIGLALGVLLVGACAALFFRNETRPVSNVPRLQHAQELDDRIAEKSTHPYLKGIEAIEAADRRRLGSDDDQNPSSWNPVRKFLGWGLNETAQRDRERRAKKADEENDVQELAPLTIKDDGQFNNPVVEGSENPPSSEPIAEPLPRKTEIATSNEHTHVVQKGETLSSIAAKTLGSPSRFHELFEANQDQLNNPNDVKLGMTLRIPQASLDAVPKPHHVKARSPIEKAVPAGDPTPLELEAPRDFTPPSFDTNSRPTTIDLQDATSIAIPPVLPTETDSGIGEEPPPTHESSETKRFVPARRLPLPGRQTDPQAKSNLRREPGARRLSQALPDSASGKIAR